MTFAVQREPPTTDPMFGGGSSRGVDGVAEKLGMVNWGVERDEYDLTGAFFYFPDICPYRSTGGKLGNAGHHHDLRLPHPPGRSLAR